MPQRNVATHFTFEQQRQEINLLASDFWTQKQTVDNAADTYLKADGTVATTAALTLGGNLVVPNAFTINPDSGNGTVTISGNLQVDGTTTTLNSATLEIADKNLVIASGSSNNAASNGGGITLKGTDDKTITYNNTGDKWVSNKDFEAPSFLGSIKTNDGAGSVLIPGATSNDFSQLYNTVLYNSNGQAILSVTAGSEHFNGVCEGLTGTPDITVGDVIASSLDVSGNSTFGANGSITSGGNFTLNGNGFVVTGTQTAVGEFKGATIPTIQITQTTDNTDLQLRANATGGLVRTASNKPLIFGTSQEERLRIHESSGSILVNNGNAETNATLVLSKADAGFAKLEFDVGTSQKAYVELDASEDLIHYGAANVGQTFYAGGSTALTIDASQNSTFQNGLLTTEGAQEYASSANDLATSVSKAALRVKGSSNSSDSLWMGVETVNAFPYLQGANGVGNNAKNLLLNPFGGNVGVGKVVANATLDIATTNSTSTGTHGFRLGAFGIRTEDVDSYNVWAIEKNYGGWGSAVVLQASGRVGIGTGTAATELDALLTIKGDSNGDSVPSIRLKDGSDSRECWISNVSGDLYLANGGNDNAYHSRIRLMDGRAIYFDIDGASGSMFSVDANDVYDSKGPIRSVPQNTQTGNYTLTHDDNGKHIFASGNVTIPPSIFTAGDIITVVNNTAGDIQIVAGAGQGIYNSATASTAVPKTLAQRGMATILITNSSTCYVSGTSLSDP